MVTITVNTWGIRQRVKLLLARVKFAVMYRKSDWD